jgi:hypothetical protein
MLYNDFLAQYQQYQERPDTLTPPIAEQLLVQATGILANISGKLTAREHEYNVEYLKLLTSSKSAAEAKVRAGATETHRLYKEAERSHATLLEVIRTLKKIHRRGEEEYKHTPR